MHGRQPAAIKLLSAARHGEGLHFSAFHLIQVVCTECFKEEVYLTYCNAVKKVCNNCFEKSKNYKMQSHGE